MSATQFCENFFEKIKVFNWTWVLNIEYSVCASTNASFNLIQQ